MTIITHHISPYIATQGEPEEIAAMTAPNPMTSFEDTTHAYEAGYAQGQADMRAAVLRSMTGLVNSSRLIGEFGLTEAVFDRIRALPVASNMQKPHNTPADMGNPITGDLVSREAAIAAIGGATLHGLTADGGAYILVRSNYRDALRALPAHHIGDANKMAAPAVKVRPLEWHHSNDGTMHDNGCHYEIERDAGMWRVVRLVMVGGRYVCHADTPEAAKAAAQADYEARILAALEGGVK